MARRKAAIVVILSLCAAAAAFAQRQFRGDFGYFGFRREPTIRNVAYDGRFTFVRVKYTPAPVRRGATAIRSPSRI